MSRGRHERGTEHGPEGTVTDGVHARGLRFLRARWRVLTRLGAWSVLETAQTFLTGYAPARALDEGFLAGRPGVGLGWLGVAGLGVLVGAYGTVRVYAAVAALVEPLRDVLVERVVERGVREADAGALSGLTQQVEIARDTFAGLVLVSRSFVFTAVGAVVGLASLSPLLLLVVGPPLAAGLGLFAATLRPLARRQECFLRADEALADGLGRVCPGLRDITAAGAEERVAADMGRLVDTEQRAAYSLAHWSLLRVASLALGGQLPIVLLLACAPWLLARGVTPGALVGALAYVTQSLLPALRDLVHGLGTSGSRLVVVLRRLVREPADESGTAGHRPQPAAKPDARTAPRTPRRPPAPSATPENRTHALPPTTQPDTRTAPRSPNRPPGSPATSESGTQAVPPGAAPEPDGPAVETCDSLARARPGDRHGEPVRRLGPGPAARPTAHASDTWPSGTAPRRPAPDTAVRTSLGRATQAPPPPPTPHETQPLNPRKQPAE
ncbi:hypothetical protein ACI2L1_17655, partial [Streptomyces sp. NPDC019531]